MAQFAAIEKKLHHSFADRKIITIFAVVTVCHDDEMTLGSGSFSGISQQLPKRW